MYKNLLKMCCLVLCCVSQWSLAADNLAELMQKSGLNQQLAMVPEQIMVALKKVPDLPETQKTLFETIVNDEFSQARLQKNAAEIIALDLSSEDIKTVLAWLNSPLGKRFTQAEEEASTPEAMAEMAELAPSLLQEQARVAVLVKLNAAIGGTEGFMHLMSNITVALVSGMMAYVPAEQRLTEAQIRAGAEQNVATNKNTYEQYWMAASVYSYRDFTPQELTAYLDFATSEVGQRYHASSMQAVDSAISNASRGLGGRLARQGAGIQ
jgi:hypothetical protein